MKSRQHIGSSPCAITLVGNFALSSVTSLTISSDKVSADQKSEAHSKFQSIAFAYAVLSDPTRRKRYDETGSTSESIVDSEGFSWTDFYREQFRDSVSEDAIKKFAEKYKKSNEEKDDLLAAYEEYEGDMDQIYATVMLSNVLEDDARFRETIDAAIEAGDVESFSAYTEETAKARKARLRAAKAEAQEAEEYAKELGVHDKLFGKKKGKKEGEADLAALIRRKQEDRGTSFLDHLAEKYGAASGKGKASKKRKGPDADEPDEEAFQAAAARLARKTPGASSVSQNKGKATKRAKR
jgi:DnaJ family protein C protein 9